MEQFTTIKVLFIAGFGPIVRDGDASGKLYRDVPGISFKEESGGYFHTEALDVTKMHIVFRVDDLILFTCRRM